MISVIIPSGVASKYLNKAIDSIYSQTNLKDEIEVILVSQECPIPLDKYKNFKFIKIDKNIGVTGGRNLGAKNVSSNSKYLLFFDHDIIADPNMILELLKGFEFESVGITTPKIYYGEEKNIIWSAGTEIDLKTGRILFRGGEDKGQFDKLEEVSVAPGIIMVKRQVYEDVNGFDDIYFVSYEDTDFCFKAKAKGIKTFYIPKAVCYHYIPYDTKISDNRLLDRLYYVGRNRIIFMRRYGKNMFLFSVFYVLFSVYFVLLSLKYFRIKPIFNYFKGALNALSIEK